MPDRDGGRERERRVERTQRTGCKRFSGHVATAKLLTSDWPLEETGLTAPPTLHCPISSRSIARPSIIDSHPPPLLFPVLFACPMARAGSFLVKKVMGQNDWLIVISRRSIRNSRWWCDLLFLRFNHFAKLLSFCFDLFEEYLDPFDVKISWVERIFEIFLTW